MQNKTNGRPNHGEIIAGALAEADEARLFVAYVRENGVNMILGGLENKPAKLLCSFDMGITQISGIRKLLENNVEVRVYKSSEGTFHAKVWLFKSSGKWRALVGSANLTRAAFVDNTEASVFSDDKSITADAVSLFNYLWEDKKNVNPVNLRDIDRMQEEFARRSKIKSGGARTARDDAKKIETMLSFIRSWIDIAKEKQEGISSLWRGWYIIPDQGYVKDELAENLAAYLPFIDEGIRIEKSAPSPQYKRLLAEFVRRSKFQREKLKLQPHDLFVRQAKNYLIKFGWAHHPLMWRNNAYKQEKNVLFLTAWGRRVAACQNIAEIKQIYSEYFEDYAFNGLRIVKFTRQLLERFGYLDLREFNYFVVHAYNDDDMETISELIAVYRSCDKKRVLNQKVQEYFDIIMEPTAVNVRGNYVKKGKHTMSAIGWCSGFSTDLENFTIRLNSDAN
ncbi:MAG: phospholipase D-like domain-containing protein [Gammaproteobacteria bacterium]